MATKKTVARVGDVAPAATDEEWEGAAATRVADACAVLTDFIESAEGGDDDDKRGAEAVEAWRALSIALMQRYSRLVPAAAWFARVVLITQRDDPEGIFGDGSEDDACIDDAVSVAHAALGRLSGEIDERGDAALRKMAGHVGARSNPRVALRERILDTVAWSFEPAFGCVGADATSGRRLRVRFLREMLGQIDPRLRLPERDAETLVRLHWRSNGARSLAANWAWRANIEKRRDGESLDDDAPARIRELYGDAEKKRAKVARLRARGDRRS